MPFVPLPTPAPASDGRTILAEGPKFVMERWSAAAAGTITLPEGVPGWFVPLTGAGALDGQEWKAGECWTLAGSASLSATAGSEMLFAYPLAKRADILGG